MKFEKFSTIILEVNLFSFSIIHLLLHFLIPLIVALLIYRNQWKRAFFIMAATILVDLDHLLADPIFDPDRCSIGFHPLHSYYAVAIYFLLLIPVKTRLVALGLVIHMSLDFLDCYL